ncbi:MAG: hypothetical protein ACPHA6_14000, partial [Paracoccaceae bacterium]
QARLTAVPIADTSVEKQSIVLKGDVSAARDPPTDVRFRADAIGKRIGQIIDAKQHFQKIKF